MREKLRDNEESITTSEYAKNWTEKSPNSKLGEINRILNETTTQKIKEINNLKIKIKNHEYRDFQKAIGLKFNRCDGKLGNESFQYFKNYINKLKLQNNITIQSNDNLQQLETQIQSENVVDTIRIKKNEAEYLAKHETMSEAEYNQLFSGKENLQQGQIGNCYLVSSINELARAQHFDTLMRTSIQRIKWKDGSSSGYQIKIPLGEPSGRKILLKDSELKIAKIKGNTGYKLLELAYAKNKLMKNNISGNIYRPITEGEFSKIRGGHMKEVFETFLGKKNISFNTFGDRTKKKPLEKMTPNNKRQINGFLKNYIPNIGNKFVSLSSIGGESDTKQYTIGGKRMYHKHSYALTGVNKDSKGNIKYITVLNPWNKKGDGNNYLNFTMDEFFKAFSYMSCGKIKTKSFLNEGSTNV